MLAYQMLQEEEQGLSLNDVDMKSTFCPVNGEKILKTFKTHVGAMDFDNNTFQKATFYSKRINQFLSHVSDSVYIRV
jgi:hypothetical protein